MRTVVLLSLLLLPACLLCQVLPTKYEKTKARETPTYHEIISWWKTMDEKFPTIKMRTMGPTDAGFPLHLVIVSNDRDFDMASLRKKNKRIILINNGIHPGEPDGIDASMLLVRDIVTNKKKLPANVVLAIIPVYNIGGCLNRSSWYRVDQNGPETFGSRGNSQNLDLNRDFIKCDSKEARSFAAIFHLCDPDVFVDNHVSNGADYQHVMTLLTTQHNKLGGVLGKYLHDEFEPGMYKLMKQKGYDLVPYVDFNGKTPEAGMTAYFDGPRYSSGYAALWHSFSFVPETHMLKPYKQRVESTYALMECFIEFTSKNSEVIRQLRDQTKNSVKQERELPLNWKADTVQHEQVQFKGYEAGYKTSEVSGLQRLYYDRTKPYEQSIDYYNTYRSQLTIKKPTAYIIPQGWWKVIELLKLNRVSMRAFTKDTTVTVTEYHIEDYRSLPRPYEMHHLNSDVKLSSRQRSMNFRKGDYYIPMNQVANRFLIEVLEPQGDDSYFAWNYFDGVLQRREWYSAYAFEDTAAVYLKQHPEISDSTLETVYKNSPWYEPDLMRYPVYRLE